MQPSTSYFRQLIALLWLALSASAANATQTPAIVAKPATAPNIHFSQSKVPGAELQLDVKQATLTDVIAQIAAKTNVVIHYSVLPEAPVSATCVAGKVQQLMECLVGKQIGVVAHKGDSGKDEIWLLGSSVGHCPNTTASSPAAAIAVTPVLLTPEQQAENDRAQQEHTQAMLKLAKSKDPNERFSALGNLADPANDNPEIGQALREALKDKDANVRTQAVASIAQRGGDDINEQMSQALQDKDPNVRMSVVSFATADSGVLQQALNDRDPAVRNLAQTRIADLERRLAKQTQ